ncbi:hypothetical protein, partial, partial [Parasitella parasitica]
LPDATSESSNDLSEKSVQVILPSSFASGPRFMSGLYQDAMALSRFFGKPTFFITLTANPKWKEITDVLEPDQTALDFHDIISRVFNLKCRELLDDIKKNVHSFLFLDDEKEDSFDISEKIGNS